MTSLPSAASSRGLVGELAAGCRHHRQPRWLPPPFQTASYVKDNSSRLFFNSILLLTNAVCWHCCWHFLTGNNNGFGYSEKLNIGSARKYRLAHYA
jgi:hypothetical protein